MIDLLITEGVNLNSIDHFGSNSLILSAICRGDMAIYQKLIVAGVSPVLSDESAQNLLSNGVLEGSPNRLAIFNAVTGGKYISK